MHTTHTIVLSDRAPVCVDDHSWPLVASAHWHHPHDQPASQASEVACLRVRQHADGRAVVYGRREQGPGGAPPGYQPRHAGYLLRAGDDVVRAIRRVAGALDLAALASPAIAGLPPEVL